MKSLALFFCIAVCLAQLGASSPSFDVVDVKAVGVGPTPDLAKKDALNNAVQQAVGMYVDSETIAKNDQVIKEQVLILSNGSIDNYEVVEPPAQRIDGAFQTTIRARVKKNSVLTALLNQGIGTDISKLPNLTPVDPKDIGNIELMLERERQGRIILSQRFRAGMLSVLEATALCPPDADPNKPIRPSLKPDRSGEGRVFCAWNVEVRYNRKRYQEEVSKHVREILRALGTGPSAVTVRVPAKHRGSSKYYDRYTALLREPIHWWEGLPLNQLYQQLRKDVNEPIMLVCLDVGAQAEQQQYECYALVRPAFEKVIAEAYARIALRIRWVRADGSVIFTDMVPLTSALLFDTNSTSGKAFPIPASEMAVVNRPFGQIGKFSATVAGNRKEESVCAIVSPQFWCEARLDPAARSGEGSNQRDAVTDSLIIHYEKSALLDDVKQLVGLQMHIVPAPR